MVEQRAILDELKRRRTIRNRKIWLIAVSAFVVLVLFWYLFSFTDVILGIPQESESQPQGSEWAMFRRDLQHSGSYGANDVTPSGNLKWTFTAGGAIHSSPAVVDGTVYFGSQDSHLYALDADTGEQKWAFKAGSWVESSPVVVGGVVYFGCNDGNLYALNAQTGEKIWAYKTRYAIRSSPAVAGGVVYFGSDDRSVYAVDAETGKGTWSRVTGDMVLSAPAISNGYLVIGSVDGLEYTFNAKNGRSRLKFDTFNPVIASPAVRDGVAYFSNSSGYFYAVDISKKNWLWENKVKYYWNALYIYGVAPKPPAPSGHLWGISLGWGIHSASSAALSGNNAYLGVGNNVVSIDLTTRKAAWSFSTKDMVTSSPAITGSALFAGGYDGHVYALDKATGEKLWDYETGAKVTSSPAVVDGMLYIGSHDGNLYAFE